MGIKEWFYDGCRYEVGGYIVPCIVSCHIRTIQFIHLKLSRKNKKKKERKKNKNLYILWVHIVVFGDCNFCRLFQCGYAGEWCCYPKAEKKLS